jgi:hypothetical protein
VPVAYEFVGVGDAFVVSRPFGVLPANSSVHTSVAFQGPVASHYWRRVACVLQVRAHERRVAECSLGVPKDVLVVPAQARTGCAANSSACLHP